MLAGLSWFPYRILSYSEHRVRKLESKQNNPDAIAGNSWLDFGHRINQRSATHKIPLSVELTDRSSAGRPTLAIADIRWLISKITLAFTINNPISTAFYINWVFRGSPAVRSIPNIHKLRNTRLKQPSLSG